MASLLLSCCPRPRSVTQGFSGTDDLKHVLPATIEQRNLESLKMTTGIQLQNLLKPENDFYRHLGDGLAQTAARVFNEDGAEQVDVVDENELSAERPAERLLPLEGQEDFLANKNSGKNKASAAAASSSKKMNALHDSAAASMNSAEEILQTVIEDGSITVVLDPGALVLQLSNYEFCRRWLEKRPDKVGVFDHCRASYAPGARVTLSQKK